MSYTPTVWANGDVITSEKLNKVENGVQAASGQVVFYEVNNEGGNYHIDASYNDILAHIEAGQLVVFSAFGHVAYFAGTQDATESSPYQVRAAQIAVDGTTVEMSGIVFSSETADGTLYVTAV